MIDDPITIISKFCSKKDLSSGQDQDMIVIWSDKDLIVPNSAIIIMYLIENKIGSNIQLKKTAKSSKNRDNK